MCTSSSSIMEDLRSEIEEEMSFEQNIYQDLSRDRRSFSLRKTFRQGLFAVRAGPGFPHHRLVILTLGLLNAVLLIAAVVIGIHCDKAKDLQILDSSAASLVVELKYLRNHSDVIRAKTEAQAALVKERTNHVQLKLQLKQKMAITDMLLGRIEILELEKANIQTNRSTLDENCGRCQPDWLLLKSSCYYFSRHEASERKNWSDSRADCISRGGDLLVINNLGEQQIVSDHFPRQSSIAQWWLNGYWIGLTDLEAPGTWAWIHNVTDVTTMYWRFGQPNLSGPQSGNCAAFFNYGDSMKTFYNGNCNQQKLNWICEMQPRKV
ncbi:uncharacterized protein [Leuresthes tenuis]|uniref:uncharacterized protein n=1 Tax=Leuresthes tenuis TaxID=355514 RepID=UPI003B5040C4